MYEGVELPDINATSISYEAVAAQRDILKKRSQSIRAKRDRSRTDKSELLHNYIEQKVMSSGDTSQ
jgi:hypothetical protein